MITHTATSQEGPSSCSSGKKDQQTLSLSWTQNGHLC